MLTHEQAFLFKGDFFLMSLLAVLLSKIDVDPCFVQNLKMKLLIEFKLSTHGSDVPLAMFVF